VAVVGLEFQVRSGNAVSETKKLTTAAQQLENAVNNASTRLRDANGRFISTGRSAANASNGIRQFNAATTQTTRSVGLLEDALGGLSARLATGLAFGQAIRSATEFESIISDIGKTSNASQKDLDAVATTLKQLSAPAKTNLAPTVLARGLQDLVAQGLNLPDAVASLETLGKVATATNSELTDVTKTGFQLQSALKIRPDELKATFDALAFAGKAGAFELKDMAQYMPTIASAATSLGITGKQGAISLAAMMQMVRKDAPGAAEASTRLTDALMKMTAPDAAKNFKKFGVDIEKVLKDAVKNGINPMDAAISELIRVTGKDPFKLSQIFGDKEAKLALMSLMKYRDEYEKLKASAGGAAAAGTVQGDFQKSLLTFQGQLNSLKAASEVAAISLGTALLPILAKLLEAALPIIQTITGIANAFNSLPNPVKNNVAELVKLIVQLLLVQKTIAAVTGVAALLRGAMSLLAIQTGLTATAALRGNAAMYALTGGMNTATGAATGLLGVLRGIASMGLVAVAVNITVYGIQALMQARAELDRLRGQQKSGGAKAIFGGSAPQAAKDVQAKVLQQIQKERQANLPFQAAASISGPGRSLGVSRENTLALREQFARETLALPTRKPPKPKPQVTELTGAGVTPIGKEKRGGSNKAERDAARLKEETARQLLVSQQQLAISKQELIIAQTIDPLKKAEAQYALDQLRINQQYFDKLKDKKSTQEEQNIKAAQLNELEVLRIGYLEKQTEELLRQAGIEDPRFGKGKQPSQADWMTAINTRLSSNGDSVTSKLQDKIDTLKEELKALTSPANVIISAAESIGTAFQNSFQGIISGSMSAKEALSSFFKSVASDFLAMAAQIIAKQLIMIALNAILKIFSFSAPMGTGEGTNFTSAIGNNTGISWTDALKYTPKAIGGPVTGNASYMVGERGPEIFTPSTSGNITPNNRLRDVMGGSPASAGSGQMLNMTFETTRFGNTEYVSRDQLEAAMAQTRRQAANDGAKRGMGMTLDKLQQSPQTRSRVGIR
jgi:TP901 family phage tail tape measure protein